MKPSIPFRRTLIALAGVVVTLTAAGVPGPVITKHVSVSSLGAKATITLDATRHGEWQNVAGTRTRDRYLIDVTPGTYQIRFVDTAPGRIAWSAGLGQFALPGLCLAQYDSRLDHPSTVAGFPWTSYASTQEGAFATLTPKDHTFQISSNATLVAYLYDHILTDNSGGLSFVIEKTADLLTPVLVNIAGRGAVRGLTNGQVLRVGQAVSPKALPARGQRLANWLVQVNGETVISTNRDVPFVVQSNLVLTATFVDALKPVLRITAPTRNQRWSNSVFTVRGTAADNGFVTVVKYQLNGGAWLDAVSTNGWTNWTAGVNLQPGSNVIRAFALDADSNASATNTATVTFVEMLRLLDYQPMTLEAQWLYEGFDWDGNAAKVHYAITSTNHLITNYFGRQAVAYVTNCIVSTRAYLHPNTLQPYDRWEEFFAAGPAFGHFGDDDLPDGDDDLPDESFRVAGGLVFPELVPSGVNVARSADAYSFGRRVGRITVTIEIVEHGARSVPAGTFPDVLRIRFTFKFGRSIRVHEEWWARSVGMIKRAGVTGGGSAVNYELISHVVP
jgi:hypothetical protein